MADTQRDDIDTLMSFLELQGPLGHDDGFSPQRRHDHLGQTIPRAGPTFDRRRGRHRLPKGSGSGSRSSIPALAALPPGDRSSERNRPSG